MRLASRLPKTQGASGFGWRLLLARRPIRTVPLKDDSLLQSSNPKSEGRGFKEIRIPNLLPHAHCDPKCAESLSLSPSDGERAGVRGPLFPHVYGKEACAVRLRKYSKCCKSLQHSDFFLLSDLGFWVAICESGRGAGASRLRVPPASSRLFTSKLDVGC